jgi:CopG family nickel-responsive transcriptional regulator
MPMLELSRIGVAIDTDLLDTFDHLIGERGYTNRSEAFRDLIRAELVREASASKPGGLVVGTLTLVYDHHVRFLEEKMTDLQHDHNRLILSTLHVHLDHDRCMEVTALRGPSSEVQSFAHLMGSIKGVKHAQLAITAAAEGPAGTGHHHPH